MLSHVSLGTNDAARSAAFYDPVLATLGIRKLHERDGSLDYGTSIMFFSLEKPADGKSASVGNGVHVAFLAETRAMVDDFYRAALANGGGDGHYSAACVTASILLPSGSRTKAA